MNQLVKNVCLLAVGGIVGAFTGYLVAEIIIRQRDKQEEPEYEWVPEVEEKKEPDPMAVEQAVRDRNREKHPVKDYRQFSKEKGDLAVLVEQYVTPIKKVRIISAQEAADAGSRPFEMINYYEGDNTFCDIEEKQIDDPNTRFVSNVHLHFGEQSGDPDIVYVRNDNNGVDYEITRIRNKYSVVVLGMVEPEKEKPKRSRRTKKTAEKLEEDEPIQESEE